MSNQREAFADSNILEMAYRKLNKSNFEKAIPKTILNNKRIDITEEIIFLYALRSYKERHRTILDWYEDFVKEFEILRDSGVAIKEIYSQAQDYFDEFDEIESIILKAPEDVIMLNHIRMSYVMYRFGFRHKDIYKCSINAALGYLQGLIMKDVYRPNEVYNHCVEDDLARLCVYALLNWVSNEDNKVPKDRMMTKLIKKYIGTDLTDMISRDEKNRFGELYLGYKNLCGEEDTPEQRSEYWDSKKDDIFSDFGRLKAEDFDVESLRLISDYDNTTEQPYLRCIDDSFNTCYSKLYKSITEIDDVKSKHIIFNLIQRYVCDIDEILAYDARVTVREAIQYVRLNSEFKDTKDQHIKDLEKLREQNRLKVNKVKKELEHLKEQLDHHKTKSSKLAKDIKKLDKDAVAELESKIDELENEVISLRKKDTKHINEVEYLNNKISQLEQSLKQTNLEKDAMEKELTEANSKILDEKEDDLRVDFQSKEITSDVLYNAIKDKKILLVGGNKIHSRITERGYNNIELLRSDNVNITMHAGQKYDLVVIYTKLVSHSVVERIESELRNSKIPIIRFNQAGINSLIYTIFMYMYGRYDEKVGEYSL